MDGQRFDELAKTLATGNSRRRLLQRATGGALGGVLALIGVSGGRAQNNDGPPEKVGICHRTGSDKNPFVYKQVSAASVEHHAAHGDLVACPENFILNPETCACDPVGCTATGTCLPDVTFCDPEKQCESLGRLACTCVPTGDGGTVCVNTCVSALPPLCTSDADCTGTPGTVCAEACTGSFCFLPCEEDYPAALTVSAAGTAIDPLRGP
ncbi:MAG: hypothetical protein H0W06_03870 [Chloroflexia bacterium]|nr:hypothetical protein [Chloroflexia bacterium]